MNFQEELPTNEHKDYKTNVPRLSRAADIDDIIRTYDWRYKSMNLYFPPYEKHLWKIPENEFKIEYNKIDRVYHLDWDEEEQYEQRLAWVFRMWVLGKPVYVELVLHWCGRCDYVTDLGLFICRNPNAFFNVVVTPEWDLEKLVEFLKIDGITINFSSVHNHNRVTVPTLQSLCCIPIHKHKELEGYKRVLPPRVATFVTECLECIELDKYYTDECWC